MIDVNVIILYNVSVTVVVTGTVVVTVVVEVSVVLVSVAEVSAICADVDTCNRNAESRLRTTSSRTAALFIMMLEPQHSLKDVVEKITGSEDCEYHYCELRRILVPGHHFSASLYSLII